MPSFPPLFGLDLSDLDLSNLDLSRLEVPVIDVDRAVDVARDTAYVGVGLTVLAVQRAQVARRDVTKAVERRVRRVRGLLPV
jgi:hypothetical protein